MNFPDSSIVVTFLLTAGYVLTLLLIVIYQYKSKIMDSSTNILFFLSKFIQISGWVCYIMRGTNLDYLSHTFANSLLFISYSLEVLALLRLKRVVTKKEKMIYFIFTLLSMLGFFLLVHFYNEDDIRIFYFSCINALFYMQILQIVLTKSLSPLTRIIGSLYIIFAVISIVRGALSISSISFETNIHTVGIYQLISWIWIYIFTNLVSIGFLLILKEKSDKELVFLASYDDLTRTLNRRTFTERSTQYLHRYADFQQPVSYILFDIDNFKAINDTYGHHAGDLTLQDLTQKVHTLLDEKALFGRYGGDEFGILLPGKDIQQSTQITQQIKQIMTEASPHLPVAYTISMGVVTTIPSHTTQLQTLYTSCDKALYKAKIQGKNTIVRSAL